MSRLGRNAKLEIVRYWFHDRMCTGADTYCTGASRKDHARRTQHQRARRIVDGNYLDLMDEVHAMIHVRCEGPAAGHVDFEHPTLTTFAARIGIAPEKAPSDLNSTRTTDKDPTGDM